MIALLLACTPKHVPAPAPPPPPPPPVVIPDLSGSGPTVPDLRAGSSLELTSLTWSHVRFTISADTAALSTIDAAHADALQQHLCADPRWKVHRRSGVLTAEKRTRLGSAWRLPPSGYHEDSERMWRIAVRFDDRDPDATWAESELVSLAQAGDPTITVNGTPLLGEQDGQLATAIVVEAPQLAVEIFEAGPEGDRRITAKALGSIPVVLPGVSAERVATSGFDPSWMSAVHVRSGEASAALQPSEAGFSEVTGWLNPGGPGWTWLRLLDAEGLPWQDEVVPAWSTERIGWGDGLFFFQAIVPTPEPVAAVTAQIWHLPDGEQAPVKLLEWPL